ncbi:MAG: ATP-dependent helicase HrpB [Alphaproteobacteria bacterium]|nr:ATP-dependent helicase HrpB [Alphaproteobacteria bacterium]
MFPVDDILPALKARLRDQPNAVLVAQPGAGKSTRVPPALIDEPWVEGRKLIVLAPRRLAARAAASFMAKARGEAVGETIGYRVRLDSRSGPKARIEVVTEGVFTRMILSDPGLGGIAGVLFDEFHERSLDGDLGLALALDAQASLRDDLRILVMSATLDATRVATLLGDAPTIESEGHVFPVETRYLGREPRGWIEPQMAEAVQRALRDDQGDILVFLPGTREIRRTERLIAERAPANVIVAPLYGALEAREQDRAIEPAPAGKRKIVLATSIAETSLTIEGVRVVIDSGLARVPRYDPGTGLTRLVTERAARSAVDQRRGRAGRVAPGICYRLWDEAETRALRPFATPEILESDLSGFRLALADWGASDPATLKWLDPPPAGAIAEATALLKALDALDADNRLTPHGKRLATLPLPPRLAHMICAASERGDGALAARLALALTERELGGTDVDIRERLRHIAQERGERVTAGLRLATQWQKLADGRDQPVVIDRAGAVLALAYPERIAKARAGRGGEFLLANGRGALVEPSDPLARAPFLAIAELTGDAARQRILLASPLDESDIEQDFAAHIETRDEVMFDTAAQAVRAKRVRRLGAIVLNEGQITDADPALIAAALLDGIRALGLDALNWREDTQFLRARLTFMRQLDGDPWPDLSNQALMASLDHWLGPFLHGKRALRDLSPDALHHALEALISFDLRRRLDAIAPTHFVAPSGLRVAIDYAAEGGPAIAVRVQDLFGLGVHPMIADGRVALVIHLLSPAHRPVQVTRDLPGFWRGSYRAVRGEMKGRYPKHSWPEDPLAATPPAKRR